MGFPFLSGFFSKELIIQIVFLYNENPIAFLIIELSTMLTILYSLKIFYYLFFKKNFNNRKFIPVLDFNIFNYIPLIILVILSVFSGYLFKTIFVGYGNNFFYGSIFTLNQNTLETEFISFYIKIVPIVLLLVLSFFFYEFYIAYFIKNHYLYFYLYDVFLFFNKRMFIDSLLNLFINFFFFRLSYKMFFLFDKGFLEVFGPFGIISSFYLINNKLYKLFYGKIKNQVFVFFLFFVLVLIFYFFFLVCLKVL